MKDRRPNFIHTNNNQHSRIYKFHSMKDIFRILEKSKKSYLQKVVALSSVEYPNSQWQALNLIESSAQQMLDRVSEALPKGFSKSISKVRLELLKDAGEGEKLFLKAQIYQYNKKDYQLWLFKPIYRLNYQFHICPNNKVIHIFFYKHFQLGIF